VSKGLSYKDSGVDISSGDEATRRIKQLVKKTYGPRVLNGIGGFGGLFAAEFSGYKTPVLVSSADGVGTKLKLAFMTGKHDTVGQDLVNHCVDDILAMGAEPLYFLDYFACGRLEPGVIADVVKGLSKACRENNCALIGGETAEMPGFYSDNEYDLAGFIVGVVERSKIIDGSKINPGDQLIGLASTGLHTNGFSLARKLFFDKLKLSHDSQVAELGCTVSEALLKVHRSYLKPIQAIRRKISITGLAHITGGGIPGNLVRILPTGCRAVIRVGSWKVPPIFTFMQTQGKISAAEMYNAFNMGIGMIVVVHAADAPRVIDQCKRLRVKASIIGEIEKGRRQVVMDDSK